MKYTELEVYIESYCEGAGGTVTCTATKNLRKELAQHTFPAGVIQYFAVLRHFEARVIRVYVLTDYVERHNLLEDFGA